jgi:hypothetical protein
MASPKDTIKFQLGTAAALVEMFTKDLSDEEYYKVAVPGANHAGWIVGHLAVSADSLAAGACGGKMRFPQEMHDLFNGQSECKADASSYPSRKEIEEMFTNSNAHTMEDLATFDESKWDNPSPDSMPKDFFPTVGTMWNMIGAHPFWHIGQLTTNRVAMGKPRALGGN